MKKSIISFLVYSLFLLLSFSTIAFAVSPETKKTTPTPAPEQAAPEEKEVEYTLPYPGILPDHPLYALKNFRDKIMDFLIRDPIKKAEFNLLMSDKRVNMGLPLLAKGKGNLALTITTEAQSYFDKALDELKKAENQGQKISSELTTKLATSLQKHQEVITNLQKQVPEDNKAGYGKVLETIKLATKQASRNR